MPKKKPDAVEVLRAAADSVEDLLDPDYPEELVDAELRAMGLDPDEVGRRGEAFVAELMAERAEAERKASTRRLRSRAPKGTSVSPARAPSSLPPLRAKQPSDAGPTNEE